MGGRLLCPEAIDHAVKCPRCGFVSFAGLSQCKKCGHKFVSPARKEGKAPSPDTIADFSVPLPLTDSPATDISQPAADQSPAPRGLAPDESATGPRPSLQSAPPAIRKPGRAGELPIEASPTEPVRPWREELAERVENFRRRRARLRQGFDPATSLDLEFGAAGAQEIDAVIGGEVAEFSPGKAEPDILIGTPITPQSEVPVPDSLPLEKPGSGLRILSSAAVEAGELALDQGAVEPEPVEIVLESSPASPQVPTPEVSPLVLPVARLGPRFLAGVMDALLLLLGAGLFALIFWSAGGRLSPQLADFAVLAFIVVFYILAYFGLFTALTASTPGLLWMGLEVRKLDGTFPTGWESFWRTFGYLVSITSLMMGFIWALVDSDGLTWHDRMSGTFITART